MKKTVLGQSKVSLIKRCPYFRGSTVVLVKQPSSSHTDLQHHAGLGHGHPADGPTPAEPLGCSHTPAAVRPGRGWEGRGGEGRGGDGRGEEGRGGEERGREGRDTR